jgi:hypothetical protein
VETPRARAMAASAVTSASGRSMVSITGASHHSKADPTPIAQVFTRQGGRWRVRPLRRGKKGVLGRAPRSPLIDIIGV